MARFQVNLVFLDVIECALRDWFMYVKAEVLVGLSDVFGQLLGGCFLWE